jgi:1-acyl-sn-glycerol-3-phosphate acyltransferase
MAQWLFPPCNFGFKTTLKWFADYKIEGQENIPTSGPVLVVSNHLSNLDPAIVAAALPRPPVFLAKKELFKYSVGAFLMRGYGAYPVDRRGGDVGALNWIIRQLSIERRIVIVFPEGTRSRTGGLLRGQPGLALLAISTGAPVVPVALTGSEPLQNTLKVLKPTATIRLKIGRPFVVRDTSQRPSRETASALTTEIMVRISQMLPEDKRGEYSAMNNLEMTKTVDYTPSPTGGTA